MSEGRTEEARLIRENDALRRQVAALEAETRRFRATLYSIGDAVISTDAAGAVVQMNPVAEALTGWPEAEARGRPTAEVFRIVNEETRAEVESPVVRVLREGVVVGLANHTLLVAKDGTARPIADSGAPIRDERGAVTGVVLVFRDQTAERAAQKALHDSEVRFRPVFENSPLGKSMTEISGGLRVNKAFASILGYSEDELRARTWQEITHPDDVKESADNIQALLGGKKSQARWEKRYLHKSGRVVWTDVSTSLQRDGHGEPLFFITTISDITERKRMEAELRSHRDRLEELVQERTAALNRTVAALHRTEEQSRATLYSIGDGVISTDAAGRVTRMNPVAERLTGWGEAEALGKPLPQVFHIVNQETRLELKSPVELVLQEGKVVGLANHTLLIARDGTARPIADSGAPIRDQQGEVTGVVLVFRDQTAERAAQQAQQDSARRLAAESAALRRSQARLKFIMDAGPGVLYTCEAHGAFAATFISENVSEQMGFAARQFLEDPGFWASKIHPDDAARVFADLPKVFETGSHEHEYRFLHANGSYVWMHDSLRLVQDEQGQPVELIGLWLDITDARKARDLIQQLSAERQLILDSVPSAIWYKDTENRFLRVNRAGAASAGRAVADIEGKSAAELFPAEAEKYFQDDLEVIRSGRPKLGIVERLRQATGDLLWVRTDKVPTKDEAGNCTGLVVFVTDITDQRRAQERIEQANLELAAANQELEAFSYSVSHDLRAPLRAIDGFTRLLADDYAAHLDAEGKRLCAIIRENTGKMSQLIDDLLAFSRLGRAEMSRSRVDMGAMANAIFHELTTPESRARIDFQVGPVPPAIADPTLMRQVWANLLSNAIKFSSRRDRAVIRVSAERAEGESVYTVRDNGAGFDMQYVHKLFGVFQRLHSSREFEGTGVGLALVQRVIRRHGGRVWAEGEPDRGATFHFALAKKGD